MSLGIDFYKKLIQVCNNAGCKPEDVLLIMTIESGLNPKAVNKDGGASGLVQFMPFVLKGKLINYNEKEKGKFSDLSGTDQLDYIEKHLINLTKTGKVKNATHLYIGNFFPVALYRSDIQQMSYGAPIVESNPTYQKYKQVPIEKEIRAYNANKALDYDKDGVISYGDIDNKIKGAANSAVYKQALSMLNKAKSNFTGDLEPAQPQILNQRTMSDNNLLEIIKKHLIAEESKKTYFDVVGENIEDKAEYARIFSFALKQELGINSRILRNSNDIQLRVDSNQDIDGFIKDFNKDSIFNANLEKSFNMGYKIATPSFQNSQYRKQLIKRING